MIEKAEDVGDQGPDAAKAPRADDFGGFAPRAKEVAKVEALNSSSQMM